MQENNRPKKYRAPVRNELKTTTSISILSQILAFADEVAKIDGSSRNEVIQNTLLEYLPRYKESLVQKLTRMGPKAAR